MTQINVHKLDSVNMKIDCDDSIAKELNQFFTFEVPNYQYTPAYKNKKWDGMIRLFNLYSRRLYIGLMDYLIQFAKDRNYTIEQDFDDTVDIDPDEIEQFIASLNLKMTPYDYQLEAIKHAIKNQRSLLLSPTGSGKSLIIYCLARYCLEQIQEDEKVLIVVPTTGLVSQMYNDFRDYAGKEWKVEKASEVIEKLLKEVLFED